MSTAPEVSVLIVTHNHASTVHFCLDSLAFASPDQFLQVILVDNASNDGTLVVAEKYPGLKIIRNRTNLGFCAANNLGLSQVTGEYVLLLNPDARVEGNFLSTAIQTMQEHPRVAQLACKVLRMDTAGHPVLQDGLPVIDTVGIAMHRNRKAVDIGQGEADRGQYDQEGEVWGVCGAVCLCRRSALLDIMVDGQVFDEAFFAYKEDVDLSWRLHLYGWKCWYTPLALAYHARGWKVGSDRRAISRHARYHSFKNRRIMILKNETRNSLLPDLLPILWFELQALAYALVKEPFLLKAYPAIWKAMPRIRHWRKVIHQEKSPRQAVL